MWSQGASSGRGSSTAKVGSDAAQGTRGEAQRRDAPLERDVAELDAVQEVAALPSVPAAALDLPPPAWIGLAVLVFLALLVACTVVRPRLIRRIKGLRRRKPRRATPMPVPEPAAVAPAARANSLLA